VRCNNAGYSWGRGRFTSSLLVQIASNEHRKSDITCLPWICLPRV